MSDSRAAPGVQPGQTHAQLLAREIESRVHAPLVKTAGLGNVLAALAAHLVEQDERIAALEGKLRGLVPPGERFSL